MRKLWPLALLTLVGCSDADDARKTLYAQGYTDVQITGWQLFGCSESDTFNTGFRALSVTGTQVSGNVCKGIFKGATVRTN